MVTHDESLTQYATRVVRLDSGKIISDEAVPIEVNKCQCCWQRGLPEAYSEPIAFVCGRIGGRHWGLRRVSSALCDLSDHAVR